MMIKSLGIVELEDMGDEQLRTLAVYLEKCVRDSEIEEDWRDGETNSFLPLLRGLVRYLRTEHLGEEILDYVGDHEDYEDSDELDF